VSLLLLKHKRTKITELELDIHHFLDRASVLWQYYWLYLIRIDGASYLNEYCSLMFFMHVVYVFYKTEKKHVFNVFLFAN